MKRLLVILLLIPFLSLGQQKQTQQHYLYVEIIGKPRTLSNKVNMEIDYGQELMLDAEQMQLIDSKIKNLDSMVDAMNFMSILGWEFVQAYTAENGASLTPEMALHWLLKKEFYGLDKERIFVPR